MNLRTRYDALHRDMVDQLERTAAVENHWLIYVLLAWELLAVCGVSYYFVEVAHLQAPHRWPYGVLWLAQTVIALVTVYTIRGRRKVEESPLETIILRLWLVFWLLCCDVVILNVFAGLPVFVFLPILATLGSFGFLILSIIVSRRFLPAALVMFVSGSLMARWPTYGFLIYGGAWFLVLHALGLVFFLKKRTTDNTENTENTEKDRERTPESACPLT